MTKSNSKKKTAKSIDLAAQAGAAQEVVNRFGSAEKCHIVSYSGVDNETGKTLTRGLKKNAASKVNPIYRKQNLKQQGGYAAEGKYVARENAENIINGKKVTVTRTDDIGRVNDPLYDHVLLNEHGMEILGSGEQMKFVGGNPKACLDKLASEKFQKYLDADATITVPSDFYEGVLSEADKKIAKLHRQLDHAKASGRADLEERFQRRIDKFEKIKSSVKNSGITNAEAIKARLHPKLSVAEDMTRLSHRAGMEQAKMGAIVGGGISLIRNVVAVAKGDIDGKEAAVNFVRDTGGGAIAGYATAFAGSAIKAGMQNAGSSYIRTLSTTNLPATIVTCAVDVGKTMACYINGDITGLDCLKDLGQKGAANIMAAMLASAGQFLIPMPVVGALAGSMLGYALSYASYDSLVKSLEDAKLSKERRAVIEADCTETIRMIESYRADFELAVHHYLESNKEIFLLALSDMDQALVDGDIDRFISGANSISRKLGHEIQFETQEEFNAFMSSDSPLGL